MDSWLAEVLRGYTSEQYAEALFQLTIDYLRLHGIIDVEDFNEFTGDRFEDILKAIVERDRQKSKEIVDKYKAKEEVND